LKEKSSIDGIKAFFIDFKRSREELFPIQGFDFTQWRGSH
jgi:hypothetical protein